MLDELSEEADRLLREDARREVCRACGAYGSGTGETVEVEIGVDGSWRLVLDWPLLACGDGHSWFAGEGRARGIAGVAPVLLDEHLAERRSREIYTANGVPDPAIQRGMYFRAHPEGRALSTEKQRRESGAGFFV